VLGGALAMACGPSFQAIYEGNARFEHCYALEENPQMAMWDKAACWRDWSEHYTYGQTRDRIQYATARYVALSQAPSLPTDEALMMAAPGETPRVSAITAPAPTNAFAPPPKVLAPADGVGARPMSDLGALPIAPPDPAASSGPALPSASCADACGGTYHGCHGGCEDAAGTTSDAKKARSCHACEKAYRTCMRACFK
jgi:hypothetical protein